MLRFSISEKSVRKAVEGLKSLRKSALPYAVRRTLNDLAFEARTEARRQLHRRFILRTKFTEQRLWINRATQRTIQTMHSEMGHKASYMQIQQEGGRVYGQGEFKPLPTKASRVSKNERRRVRKVFHLHKLHAGPGTPFFVGKVRKKQGLFRRMKRRVVMLYDLDKQSYQVPKEPWLSATRDKVAKPGRVNRLFKKNAKAVFKKFTQRT